MINFRSTSSCRHVKLQLIVGTRHFDLLLLTSWISARQSAPEGGFAGRTNKLVDGCYSHWVGGCWPLLESILTTSRLSGRGSGEAVTGSLYSRDGLIRYILACCQAKRGGLRDKPGKYVSITIPGSKVY